MSERNLGQIPQQISRRRVLGAIALGMPATAFLAACGGSSKASEGTDSSPTRTTETSPTRVEASPTVKPELTPEEKLLNSKEVKPAEQIRLIASSGFDLYPKTAPDYPNLPNVKKQVDAGLAPLDFNFSNPQDKENQFQWSERAGGSAQAAVFFANAYCSYKDIRYLEAYVSLRNKYSDWISIGQRINPNLKASDKVMFLPCGVPSASK